MPSSTFFAIAGHAPDELIKELLHIDSAPYYYTVKAGERLSKKINKKYIICLRTEDFVLNYKFLIGTGKKIFVFGSPLFFMNYMGFTFLDFEIDEKDCSRIHILDNLNLNLLKDAASSPIIKHDVSYFECVVEKAKAGSIFDKLMSYIYKLPAKTHQKPVKKLCCLCVRNNWSAPRLKKELSDLTSIIKISSEIQNALTEILNSYTAVRYKNAFKLIKSESDVPKVAANADLNPYEFMYILKMLEKDKKVENHTEISIDSYLANEKK
jgi:hypothetical protein